MGDLGGTLGTLGTFTRAGQEVTQGKDKGGSIGLDVWQDVGDVGNKR